MRIVRELGKLPLGDGREFPIHLVFNSNPKQEPGPFGPYWHLPLFASSAVQFKQYRLYWDGPDEYRHFFVLDRQGDARRGETVFMHRGNKWRATVDRRGDILIEATERPGWAYRYRDGRLEEFKLGEGSAAYRIAWSGRGFPLYVTDLSSNRRVFEISYRGATAPERVIIGDRTVEVTMGDAELTAPDGESSYRNYRVSFLRGLKMDGAREERFDYGKSSKHSRTIPEHVTREGETIAAKALQLAVNRMTVMPDAEEAAATGSYVEWEAQSGFILADSGSTYTIQNQSWDPLDSRATHPVAPRAVEIRRQPTEGTEQLWSYDWRRGVQTYTNQATGEVMRKTYIMSEGPAHLKLRKHEKRTEGGWSMLEQRSYDPLGRLIRKAGRGKFVMWNRQGNDQDNSVEKFVDGSLSGVKYFEGDRLVRRERYRGGRRTHVVLYEEGRTMEKIFSESGGSREYWYDSLGRPMRLMINDKLHYLMEYADDGAWSKKTVYDKEGRSSIRSFIENFDDNGRLISRRIINLKEAVPEIVKLYTND